MKLSVLTTPLQGTPAAEAFAYLHSLGLEQVELGAGGYNSDSHLPVAQHVDHPDRIAACLTRKTPTHRAAAKRHYDAEFVGNTASVRWVRGRNPD